MELKTPKSLEKEEREIQEFLQGMLNRLAVGKHRYGEASLDDLERRLVTRVDRYVYTGSRELLMDVANFCLLIWRKYDL